MGGGEHARRIPVGRLHQNLAGRLADLGGLTAHHARQGDGAGGVGNDDVIAEQPTVDAI